MRELELFAEYLTKLRAERLQASHQKMLSARTPEDMMAACAVAHEADVVQRIASALKALDNDSGDFVVKFLKT